MAALSLADETNAPEAAFALGRLAAICDISGALWLPDERTLLVADLHFEKGASRAARGFLIPPYDTRETLSRLAAAIARRDPARVIALGDSFHDRHGPARLADPALAMERAALSKLMRGRDWLWLTGNHDPDLPESLGGSVAGGAELAGVRLTHEPSLEAGFEIAGHLHPAAKVTGRGGRLRARCFARDANRCIMPAFGAFAGGLNLRDPAFAPYFPEGATAHVIGRTRVYALGWSRLTGD
ncbi:MAG: ligase-associated DNA damage response endonuclease PdeM [Salinarimonas sp.]|nr:ligase-associated DNA damage response endonuclease PdeM [Salinarimonas sp.]